MSRDDSLTPQRAAILARMHARKPRTATMMALYREGHTLDAIGKQYGLTRERVRQIMKSAGLSRQDGGITINAIQRREHARQVRDRHYIDRWGHDYQTHRQFVAMGKVLYYRAPLGAFRNQRSNSHTRKIEWKLSFAEWWDIWNQSGKWDQRGRGHNHYVMSRPGDRGAYEVGNVFIQLADINNSNRPQKKSSLPRGVKPQYSREGMIRGYVASKMFNKKQKYLGLYRTPEEAHEAYLLA